MPLKTHRLRLKRTVNAPPAEVYRAFTNPMALRDWLCAAAQADARKGGRLYLWWNAHVYATGEYTALEPGRKVSFVWRHSREPEPARIQVSFKTQNGSTVVTVRLQGGSGKKWAASIVAVERGWQGALENLQ